MELGLCGGFREALGSQHALMWREQLRAGTAGETLGLVEPRERSNRHQGATEKTQHKWVMQELAQGVLRGEWPEPTQRHGKYKQVIG